MIDIQYYEIAAINNPSTNDNIDIIPSHHKTIDNDIEDQDITDENDND